MKGVIIALDVGGSSIKHGLVSLEGRLLSDAAETPVDSGGDAAAIVDSLVTAVTACLATAGGAHIQGIAAGMPGPFDYENGVSYMRGLGKYEGIYGMNIAAALQRRLRLPDVPIRFRNDAESAVVGEALQGAGRGYRRVIGLTLGTGLGSAFLVAGTPVSGGPGVPPGGWLYREPVGREVAEEVFSARGLQRRLQAVAGPENSLPHLATVARAGDSALQETFAGFGRDLGRFLRPYTIAFAADGVLLLGGLARSFDLFGRAVAAELAVPVRPGELASAAALIGAAALYFQG